MKLMFLGVASALSVGHNKFQSNMLLENKAGTKLLIDCGGDVRHSLFEQGYRHEDIDAIYISHLHADHTGGLEWMGFAKYFIEKKRPTLYISADQIEKLWQNVLSGGMRTLETEEATLETFFDPIAIRDLEFVWENIPFKLVKTHHSYDNNHLLPSYGLLIPGDEKKIFLSTDARMEKKALMPIYNEADLIFQDCETSEYHSNQHAHFNELKQLAPEIKRKMWLYDSNEGDLPNAIDAGFKGFVKQGQSFEF